MNLALRPPPWHVRVTPVRVTVALVVATLLLVVAAAPERWSLAYLGLVVVTLVTVRSLAVEPGSLLGRRFARRTLVVAIAAVTAVIALDPSGLSWLPLLLLVALLDVTLGIATSRIASADDADVDEFQEALRNRAHRIAYVLLALTILGPAIVAQLASPATRQWLADTVHGGSVVAVGQLLFFLPAMVVAWLEPDRLPGEARRRRSVRGGLAAALVGLCVLLPMAGAVAFLALPARVTASSAPQPSLSGLRCRSFDADVVAGVGVTADLPLHAAVCWDGRAASEGWGLNDSDCMIRSSTWATADLVACDRHTTADGSLHFTYTVDARPTALPFLTRRMTVTLVVDRNGDVVQFP